MDRKQAVVAAVMGLAALWAYGTVEAAQPFGRHPALGGGDEALVARVDPNRFIVGHPAHVQFVGGHANHEHPAVTAQSKAAEIDTNGFLVQPPASVHWVNAPSLEAQLAQVR